MAWTGIGTAIDPYRIYTIQDLLDLNNFVLKIHTFFSLENDINLDIAPYNTGEGFNPIILNGSTSYTFNFFGNGHTISGLYINRPNENAVGLFRMIRNTNNSSLWTIHGLKLKKVNVTGKNGVSALCAITIESASYWNINIKFCSISGTVNGESSVSSLLSHEGGATTGASSHLISFNYSSAAISAMVSDCCGLMSNNFNATYITCNVFNGTTNAPMRSDPIALSMYAIGFGDNTFNYYNSDKSATVNNGLIPFNNLSKPDVFNSLYTITNASEYLFPTYRPTVGFINPWVMSNELNRIALIYEIGISRFLFKVDSNYFTYDLVSNTFKQVYTTGETLVEDNLFNGSIITNYNFKLIPTDKIVTLGLTATTSFEIVQLNTSSDTILPASLKIRSIKDDLTTEKNIKLTKEDLVEGSNVINTNITNLFHMGLRHIQQTDAISPQLTQRKMIQTTTPNFYFTNKKVPVSRKLSIRHIKQVNIGEPKVTVTYELYKMYNTNRKLNVTIQGLNKTRYLVSIDSGNSWINYNVTSGTWFTEDLNNIYDNGLTSAQLADSTIMNKIPTTYANKLKFAIAVQNEIPNSKKVVTDFNVQFKDNVGPTADDFMVRLYDDYFTLNGTFRDIENDDISFRVLKMHATDNDFYPLYPSNGSYITKKNGFVLDRKMDLTNLQTGDNIVKLEVKDSRGILLEKEQNVLIYSGVTSITVNETTDSNINFTINNDRLNKVRLKIFMNGVQISPLNNIWTEYFDAPHTVSYQWASSIVMLGMPNTLTILTEDTYGNTDSTDYQFIGSYRGLLFKDISGNYYTSDANEVLQVLDFGAVIGGITSDASVIYLENKTGYAVTNVRLYTEDPDTGDLVDIEISRTNEPFTKVSEILIGNMGINEIFSFYARVDSDITAKSTSRKQFKIYAYCDLV